MRAREGEGGPPSITPIPAQPSGQEFGFLWANLILSPSLLGDGVAHWVAFSFLLDPGFPGAGVGYRTGEGSHSPIVAGS
jgi:hypothetical protein